MFFMKFLIKKGYTMKKQSLKNEFMGFILFIPFLKLGCLAYLTPSLDKIWDILKIIVFCILAFMYLLNIVKFGLNKIFVLIVIFGLSLLLSTIINKGNIYQFIAAYVGIISIYFYIDIFIIKLQNNLETMLFPIKLILLFNLISWLFKPEGMYISLTTFGTYYSSENWLIGTKNAYFPFIFFAIFLNCMKNLREYNKLVIINKDSWLYILCYINIFIISKSSTAIIGIILLSLYIFIHNFNVLNEKTIFYSCIIITILTFFGLVVFREYNPLLKLITNWLGKDITLTGRTYIWDNSIIAIKDKLIFGHGFENIMTTYDTLKQSGSHNKYLWILYRGGIINFIICMNFIIVILKNIYINLYSKECQLFLWGLFVIFTVWQTEVYDNNILIFAFLLFGVYIDKIISRKDRELKIKN